MQAQSLLQRARRAITLTTVLGAGILGCPGEDGTGVGGILVVAQVEIDAGSRDVLVGGTRQLTATPRTSTGVAVPGKVVTWSTTAAGTATVDQSGLVLGVSQGTATIRAAVEGITGQVSIDVNPVPVAAVEVSLGASTLVAGESTNAQAVPRDSIGGLLLGRPVAWSTSDPTVASVSAAGVVTTLGSGEVDIIATIEGRTGSAPLSVTPRSATRLGFLSQPALTPAGDAIVPPVRVAFQDPSGTTATEVVALVTIALAANPTGAVLSGTLTVPAVAGVATFANLRINRAGQPYTLRATATGVTAATSESFQVVAGAAASLALATAPAGAAVSGAPLGVQPAVGLRDALGNPVAQAGVVVTASLASGSGLLTGALTATTGPNGVATFADLAIVGAVGSYTIRFQSAGLIEVVSGPVGLGAGGPTQLTFTAAPPPTAINGDPLASSVRVQLRDGTGNPVSESGRSVVATLESGAGLLSGTVNAVTAANGEAVFNNLIITGVVGNFTLRFASAGLTPAISNPIAVSAGAERAVVFITPPPATAISGAILGTAPVVQLRDVSGNPVAKAGVAITVVAQSPVAGLLQGTVTRLTDAQGQATFDDLALLGEVGPYILAFRSGTLSEAIANPLQLQAGPAAALDFATAPPLGAQSGVPWVPQPVVQIVDQSGNPVGTAGVEITAARASGAGLLGGTLVATTNSSGIASFTNLALTGPSGAHTVSFSAPGLPILVAPITVGAGAATQVTFTTAPPAIAQNGVAIAPAVVVQLRDGVGNPSPLAGVTVTATRTSGPGLLGGTVSTVTNGGGSATFSNLVITGTTGNYVLTFAVPGLTPAVSNSIALTPGAATQLTFTAAPPASATNGVDLSPAVVVQLRDVSGNAVPQAGVSVAAAIASGTGAVLSGTSPVATGASGTATFSNLRLTGTAGNFTLRFSAAGVSAATSNTVALQAGAAAALTMTTQPPPSSSSGAVLNPQPVVRLVDQSGNLVATSGVTVTAALGSGPGTLGGTLTAATVGGTATFTNLAITGGTGSYTIAFTAPGLTGITSGSIGLGAGAASALQFVGTPATTATHGVAIAPSIVVRLVDGSSNPVAQSGVVVSAVLASGAGAVGGTVSATTDGTGTATFSNLILTGTVGSYSIRFDVSGISSVTTLPITLAAGAASQLTLTTPPATPATNGLAIATQPAVQLRDASGNAVSQAGVVVSAAITAGPTGALSNASATTGAGGLATFAGLTITGTAGAYTVQFSSGALTAVSSVVSLQAGPATKLAISTAPGASTTSGQLLSPQPVIQLQDQSSNAVSSGGVNVTVAFGTTPGAATLGGTTTVATNGSGQAAFTNLAISGASGGYTLNFASAGLTGASSGTITVGAGAATQLTFTTAPPASAVNGVDLAPAIVIQVRDGSGNPVNQAGISVAGALGTNAGGVLSGTTPVVTNASGVATFSNLRITGTAGTYSLAFSSAGLTAAVSNPIALQAGAATHLAFTTVPPTAAANGATLVPAPVVQLRDQSGNVVATNGVNITADLSAGAGGTLGGTLTQATSGGSATFSDLAITGVVGSYTLRFSASGVTSVSAPAALILSAGPASQLGFAVAPSLSATSGAALAVQPQVQVRDQSGNAVAQNGLLVTAVVSVGGTLANATATTNGAGLAVFSGLTITGAAGNYTLTFQATGFPDLGHGPVAIGAGAATQMVFITPPPGSATNGAALSPQPVVELRDGSGNPVLVAGTNVTVSVVGGSANLSGTTTVQTAGNGRATFTDIAFMGSPGSHTLRFTSGGVPDLDSGPITLAVGPATAVMFDTAPPGSVVNGATFGSSTVVKLVDVTGNLVPTDGVSIAVAVASGPGAVLSGTTPRLTVGGLVTFNDLVLTGTVGNYTLDFTSAGLTKATSTGPTLTPGPATQLFFATGVPAAGSSGVALSPAPVVQLRDVSNNNVLQAGTAVSAAIFSGGGGGAVLAGGSVATDGTGKATFSGLAITGPADNYSLAFTSGALTGLVSTPVAISAGGPVKLGFIAAPSSSVQNAKPLSQQPVVQLLDAANNPVAQAGVNITAAINSGSSALSGTALTVATDGNGQATFAGLTITGTVGIRTLSFSGASLTTLVSGNVDVTAGDVTGLVIEDQPPASATSGAGFSSDPSARLVDVSGNPVGTAGTSIDVALVLAGGAILNGTLTRTTDGTGLATFPGLGITGPGGSYALSFTSTGIAGATSSTITLSAASALAITTQPSASAPNNVAFAQQPAIQLVDGSAAAVALAGVTVTAAVATGGGSVRGTATAITNGAGLATFTDLGLLGTTGVHTIEFAATGLTSVTSGNITLTPGTATKLAIVVDAPGTAVDEEVLTAAPSVRLLDISDNQVDSAGVDITVAVLQVGAVLDGTSTQATTAGGVASFPGLSLDGTAGTYTLGFVGTSLTGVSSGGIALSVPAAAVLTVVPPATAADDVLLTTQPEVRIDDAGAVALAGVPVTVDLVVVAGSGTLAGTLARTTAGGGLAAWTDLKIQTAGLPGQFRLRFRTANGTEVLSAVIDIP